MSTPRHVTAARLSYGFTLVELVVVIAIISILGALMLGALAQATRSQRRDATKFLIRKLSDAVMEAYEELEDECMRQPNLGAVRRYVRDQFPDSWHEVPSTPSSNARAITKRYIEYGGGSPAYQGAECLYMIITQSGRFPELLAEIRPEQVADVDGDGKKEFIDAWGTPIEFIRWAPGYVQPPQIDDPVNYHDPFDRLSEEGTAYALYPLIYSAGPDAEYGLTPTQGWDDPPLNICTEPPAPALQVGDPLADSTTHLDNITNFEIMFE